VGRWWRRSRRVEEGGWGLGGAHECAAHDDAFAARRDVRELLFDVALVDSAVALKDTFAFGWPLFTIVTSPRVGDGRIFACWFPRGVATMVSWFV